MFVYSFDVSVAMNVYTCMYHLWVCRDVVFINPVDSISYSMTYSHLFPSEEQLMNFLLTRLDYYFSHTFMQSLVYFLLFASPLLTPVPSLSLFL